MKKLPFILAFAALALHGCDQGKPGAAKPAAPAFIGTYKGVLPCASCAGIETTLELATDGNYTLTTLFLEVPDAKPETVRGRYTQSDDKTVVRLDDNGGNYTYFIGERQLEMRDADGTIGDRSAEENANYRLQKQ